MALWWFPPGDGETEAQPMALPLRSGGTLPGTEGRVPHPSRRVRRTKPCAEMNPGPPCPETR